MKTRILFLLALGIFCLASVYGQHDPFQLAIDVHQADSIIKAHKDADHDFIIIDLRRPDEVERGFIEGAIFHNSSAAGFDDTLAKLDKNKEYLIYCASGGRSTVAFNKMKVLEFTMVYNMLGGVNAWKAAGYPLVTESTGITLIEDKIDIVQLFPNPVSNESVFVNNDEYIPMTVRIMNIQGQEVDILEIEPLSSVKLNAEKLHPGLYFYRVIADGIMLQTGKFLKNR